MDTVDSWQWRKVCIDTLLLSAAATSRYAVLSPAMTRVYNVGHLKRWFPVVTTDRATALGMLQPGGEQPSAKTITARSLPARVKAAQAPDARVCVHVHRARFNCVALNMQLFDCMLWYRCTQGTPMFVMGNEAERAALVGQADDVTLRNLELFVGPRPPDRLSLACMRPGGPLSDTNKNPRCRG